MIQTTEQNVRKRKLVHILLAIFVGGAICTFFMMKYDMYIPCIFNEITDLKCPSCGISHMFISLFKLDVIGAWNANPLMLILLPIILCMLCNMAYRYVRDGQCDVNVKLKILIIPMIVVLLVFGVLRNIL